MTGQRVAGLRALVALAVTAAACASPSRVVTTSARSPSVQSTDAATCEAEAKIEISGRGRETRYGACMIARGYSATVDVMPPSALALFMAVQAPEALEPSAVVAAIEECRTVVVARLTPPPPPPSSAMEQFFTALLGLADVALSLSRRQASYAWYEGDTAPRGPGWGLLGRSDASDAFKGCMENRQYRVTE